MSNSIVTIGNGGSAYLVHTGIVTSNTTSQSILSPSGTSAFIETVSSAPIRAGGPLGISAKLYFKYVKSKLTKTQQATLLSRLSKLQELYSDANLCGQEGLSDVLLKKLAITIREQEANVCGYDKFVTGTDIEKFRGFVRGREIGFCELRHFPRPIPKKMVNKISLAQSKGVFDEFHILFFNPAGDKPLKSNKEKIIEKDPIAFGKFSFDDRYFYICDWVDEYCDLTLDKFCETMQRSSKLKELYELDRVRPINSAELQKIKEDVAASYERLKSTNRSNYLVLAEEEAKAKRKALEETKKNDAIPVVMPKPTPWYVWILKFFR